MQEGSGFCQKNINMRVPCWDGDILYLNCSVNILVVILYYSCIICYHWEGLGKTIHKIYFFFFFTTESKSCSLAQSCPTLCDPMDCSTPGLPVPHHFPKFAQVHVHCTSDAIQSSHPLMRCKTILSSDGMPSSHLIF